MPEPHKHPGHLIHVPQDVWDLAAARAHAQRRDGVTSVIVFLLRRYGRWELDAMPVSAEELADADALDTADKVAEAGKSFLVARQLGVAESTVSRRLSRARDVRADKEPGGRLDRAEEIRRARRLGMV